MIINVRDGPPFRFPVSVFEYIGRYNNILCKRYNKGNFNTRVIIRQFIRQGHDHSMRIDHNHGIVMARSINNNTRASAKFRRFRIRFIVVDRATRLYRENMYINF